MFLIRALSTQQGGYVRTTNLLYYIIIIIIIIINSKYTRDALYLSALLNC